MIKEILRYIFDKNTIALIMVTFNICMFIGLSFPFEDRLISYGYCLISIILIKILGLVT